MTFFTFCIVLPSPNVYSFADSSFFINSKVFLQCVSSPPSSADSFSTSGRRRGWAPGWWRLGMPGGCSQRILHRQPRQRQRSSVAWLLLLWPQQALQMAHNLSHKSRRQGSVAHWEPWCTPV